MELDDLKTAWRELERRLDSSDALTVQLLREKRRLEMENEIRRRAATYFAKDSLPK